ncbi:sigma 54-interacting transcriptional regulator [Alkalihalobacillus oceani]|uniref:sigma 54-interacting transcriptional regulator n=1 Tax=Halalkalibacter oceani TaxID=1653776 RepID=UPI00203A5EEB|nr:sigma 54-interacting transcriptional regulator [Halalkalibacter oceani]MCM3762770.1 sigma 54-interacting transcriptional regulator [Halalkalibacter oceani]
MQRAMIVGGGQGGVALFQMLMKMEHIHVVAVVDRDPDAPGLVLAREHQLVTAATWHGLRGERFDFIFEVTGDPDVAASLQADFAGRTLIVPSELSRLFFSLLREKDRLIQQLNQQTSLQETILNATHDGMIAIDRNERILIFNQAAAKIVGFDAEQAIGKPVTTVLPSSGLPRVVQTMEVEYNRRQQLSNGTVIVTTRVPLFEGSHCIGALGVFKDVTDLVAMTDQVSNLKEIQTMLEAIIQSSDDAISVVDENGNGLMINPAYTRLTGLLPEEVIGHPATADISEGESMHFQVLKTGKPVRGVPLKVGPKKRDVIVNVAPIIVDQKTRGSVGVIHDVSELNSLHVQLEKAKRRIRSLEAKYSFADIVGTSAEMQLAIEQAKLAAATPVTILLRGESGTGKELFAHAIHNQSQRRGHSFVRVNCAALSEQLLESELFGYEEGAFSGAKRGGKRGLFEEADQGSIFLDELGELSAAMQAKLLRVLQEQEIVRVGGTKPIAIDVRVIAATNMNVEKAVAEQRFREDLYYRINKMPIHIPPLRERMEDLEQLVAHLLTKLNHDYGRFVQSVSDEALDEWKAYHWPGNVRELENVLGRTMIYMEPSRKVIERKDLPPLYERPLEAASRMNVSTDGMNLEEKMAQHEKQILLHSLKQFNGNRTKTAKELGISLRTLYYKLHKYDLA